MTVVQKLKNADSALVSKIILGYMSLSITVVLALTAAIYSTVVTRIDKQDVRIDTIQKQDYTIQLTQQHQEDALTAVCDKTGIRYIPYK